MRPRRIYVLASGIALGNSCTAKSPGVMIISWRPQRRKRNPEVRRRRAITGGRLSKCRLRRSFNPRGVDTCRFRIDSPRQHRR